ncbi:hypothetical protein [Aquella oligotrophica]|uniref:Regulator of chromosome condensation (RCC1) repeat protein n=1 Tax=Aquella oligotrophica TaxID=2067065 RepID=A0A2I7N8E0_9NEIS|nr:hypothetical protein [Aquella oligotrophica]AUR52729.1 hypothetical protein CUN60_10615 [Aquella oligotrophica]
MCNIDTTYHAWCWGSNQYGQLGNGTLLSSNIPIAVAGDISFKMISASSTANTCGVSTDNKVYCWGNNEYGQLGIDQKGDYKTTPQIVEGAINQDEATTRYKNKARK